jgi:hypothetical protein
MAEPPSHLLPSPERPVPRRPRRETVALWVAMVLAGPLALFLAPPWSVAALIVWAMAVAVAVVGGIAAGLLRRKDQELIALRADTERIAGRARLSARYWDEVLQVTYREAMEPEARAHLPSGVEPEVALEQARESLKGARTPEDTAAAFGLARLAAEARTRRDMPTKGDAEAAGKPRKAAAVRKRSPASGGPARRRSRKAEKPPSRSDQPSHGDAA